MLSSTVVRIALVLALIFGLRQIDTTAAVAIVVGCIAFAVATFLNVRVENAPITRSPAEFRLSVVGDAFLFTAATILGLQPGGSWGVGA